MSDKYIRANTTTGNSKTGGQVTGTALSGDKFAMDSLDKKVLAELRRMRKFNTVEVVRTDITTTAKKIELPEDADFFHVYHADAVNTLYYGKDLSITTSSKSAPLEQNRRLEIQLEKGNDNALFGIADAGTITVFAVGIYRE